MSCFVVSVSSAQHGEVEPWLNLHRHKLLQQKLASVGDTDLANVFSRVAATAMEFAFIEVGFTEKSTLLANMHSVTVTDVK